jgi:hypothetical protein
MAGDEIVGEQRSYGGSRKSKVVCELQHMGTSRHFPIAPGRVLEAWVCLVAVVLLWAPMWAAAWRANGMACCCSGLPQAREQSKTNHPRPQQATPVEAPIGCQHQGGSEITGCSMSCCHESSPCITTSVIFVLPERATICQPSQAMAAFANFAPTEFVLSFEPPYPPPRTSLFSL